MFLIRKRGVTSPSFARKSTSVGIWKMTPNVRISFMYSENAGSTRGMNVTTSLAKLLKKRQVSGKTR